jgi:Flp pilus assembly protein TadD
MGKAFIAAAVLAALTLGCATPTRQDLLEKGKSEFMAGRTEQAKATFHRTLYYYPEEAEARYALGRIAHKEGNLPEAIFYYRSCLDSAPYHERARMWLERAVIEANTEPEPFDYNY